MVLAKDASEKDIYESKKRLKDRQKQRKLDLEMKQAIDIVNSHSKKLRSIIRRKVNNELR